MALCEAIGAGEPVDRAIGHSDSVTDGRWRKIRAYALALREWQADNADAVASCRAASKATDPAGQVRRHVLAMLGEPTQLKRLRVELLWLNLQYWLQGLPEKDSAPGIALHGAHARMVERVREVAPNDPFEDGFLPRVRLADDGQLHPCHHKLFRRYDILISSIGSGSWRSDMPYRGTDGFERADILDKHLEPVESWVDELKPTGPDPGLAREIHNLLGRPTKQKRFLAALLASLLRAQQVVARHWARSAEAMRARDEKASA
jgi:hypothetical protein